MKSFFPRLQKFSLLSCVYLSIASMSASATENHKLEQINTKLSHSGGVATKLGVCPSSAMDTIVPIDSVRSVNRADQPLMTVEGVNTFIQQHNITSIDQLLAHFPDHYRNNFSLVEKTRATGQSNLAFPRIVLFGSDGHFLLNVGSKADDPKYNLLDVAEMHEDTGKWEFSVFDFSGEQPRLIRHDPTCNECHGNRNSRPVWGTVLEWNGVFGDNIAPGPQGEALDSRHMERMNEIIAGKGNSPRFDFLVWSDEPLHRGGKRKIANHAFGAELLLSNIAMGSATARASYVRLTQIKPEKYKSLREELLLAYYLKKGNAFLDAKQTSAFQKINKKLAIENSDLDSLLNALGLDTQEGFSLATLFSKETPNTNWSMGKGDLYDMLMLQILDNLRKDNKAIAKMLNDRKVSEGVLDCPNTTSNIADVIDIKMLHLFYLQGAARYEVNKKFYLLDGEDIYDRVFIPISSQLIPYLKSHVSM